MNRLQGISTPRHPLQVALILYNTCTANINTHSLTLPDLLDPRSNPDMTSNLHTSLLSGLGYTQYSNVKLTAGPNWDGGRATSPPVHEADGLAAQLYPSLVCQKRATIFSGGHALSIVLLRTLA